ncbi:hypothetical protein SUGI_0954790 [Cryptomeria japonica]|nr:hypothetical protein SUGI_0954790 [Cryptomeria japonica]
MSGGRAFEADDPQFLLRKCMTKSELREFICRIPENLASTYFPAFEEGSESVKVVFLDEGMNAWSITYIRKLVQDGFSEYTLDAGWRQVIEDKGLLSKDYVFFFGFKQSYIFIAIRRTPGRGLQVLESKSRELILLHPDQVHSAKHLASKVSLTEGLFALEYIASIYGMFEAGAASSTASPTLSLQDFEAIYHMFQERAKNCVGPVKIEECHLPSLIPRIFLGQDFQERTNLRLNQVGSANSMDQQISHPTSTSSSGHLSQINFQSRGIQTQAGAASFMAPTIQSSTNHSGYFSQTQLGAPSLTASQIQHGTLSSSSGQDSAQERGASNQEAAETKGTQIQGQQNLGNAHLQQENQASQSSHDPRNSSLELQSGGTEFKPFDTNISLTPQPKLSRADINPQPFKRVQLTEEDDDGGSGDPHGEGGAAGE